MHALNTHVHGRRYVRMYSLCDVGTMYVINHILCIICYAYELYIACCVHVLCIICYVFCKHYVL
jgi:hypothetical protein